MRFWVANQDSDTLTIHDPDTGAVSKTLSLPRGSQPYGIVFSPDGKYGFVTLQTLGQVIKLDPRARDIFATNSSTDSPSSVSFAPDHKGMIPHIRGLAVAAGVHENETRVFITRFISTPVTGKEPAPGDEAEIYTFRAHNMEKLGPIRLHNSNTPDSEDGARGIPNYLGSLSISPDGTTAIAPSKQDNMNRGRNRDGQALSHDTTIRPVVSRIDLKTNREVTASRIDLNDADMPTAAEFSRFGDVLFVALQGSNSVDVIDAYRGKVISNLPTELAPQGLALDALGRLYVQNFMSRSLTIYDVSRILDGSNNSGGVLAASVPLTGPEFETLDPLTLKGKRIFYNAADPRMSRESYISCASCHADGGSDGRVWDFTDRGEGFRTTPPICAGAAAWDMAASTGPGISMRFRISKTISAIRFWGAAF